MWKYPKFVYAKRISLKFKRVVNLVEDFWIPLVQAKNLKYSKEFILTNDNVRACGGEGSGDFVL
jgi:hypothetical protein